MKLKSILALPMLALPLNVALLIWGVLVYVTSGRTPKQAHLSLIRLFCATGGRSRDLVARLTASCVGSARLEEDSGVLGSLPPHRQAEVNRRLREDGYAVFPGAVSAAVCDRLLAFAMTTPAVVRRMDGESPAASSDRVRLFDARNPAGVRYDFAQQDLLQNPDVQDLMSDGSLLRATQNYLGCLPKLDVVGMWWHTAYGHGPDSQAAQFFHFDMDRVKWLKAFIYVTDVADDNGPHEFIAGSHRTSGVPPALLAKGYSRLTDEEVTKWYPSQARIRFTAPRGTIILEDTVGLHKGVHVTGGPRLMLQLQFSNSLFGAHYDKATLGNITSTRLRQRILSNRPIYTAYL